MEQLIIQELEERTLSFPKQASLLKVSDQATLTKANGFLLDVKAMQKQINDTFDPMIKKAHEAHREAISQKKHFETPLKEAEGIVKKEIGKYMAEQERIRKEAEEKARREREEAERKAKEEEERKLQEAIKAEETGDIEAAENILNSIPSKPEPVAAPIPMKPMTQGISTQKRWKFRIIDADKIPREYMKPDEQKIGAIVRATKGQTKIPGVEVYSEDSVSARSQ